MCSRSNQVGAMSPARRSCQGFLCCCASLGGYWKCYSSSAASAHPAQPPATPQPGDGDERPSEGSARRTSQVVLSEVVHRPSQACEQPGVLPPASAAEHVLLHAASLRSSWTSSVQQFPRLGTVHCATQPQLHPAAVDAVLKRPPTNLLLLRKHPRRLPGLAVVLQKLARPHLEPGWSLPANCLWREAPWTAWVMPSSSSEWPRK
mmetsp:Transcript_17834/g.31226  ORF Transcript_17834/g.31226 Transcript_17834/m.31226 type:complete len:205 (-) Transcript_17834:68-682(-)